MLMKPWHVTSVIRDQRQEAEILQGAKADVLVVDLARTKDENTNRILKEVKANYIVFAAGNMSNVNVVGRNAVKETVQEFKAPWWDSTDYQNFLDETRAYSEIMEAKLNADKYLVAMAKQRNDDDQSSFQAISLRPSLLTNTPRGKIHLGKTRFSGRVPRADDIESGVDNVVQNNLNSIKGEDLERINRETR
ncbi:hypothetical protein BELL_0134g00050 [Botrytis elliptica]|uniref:NAD(P)-binding domain-containing protein n=1 Tax=Botrytis elliptica TaxID=278938 RepID=A0A4Z1JTR1_9HELO|nr:hypothetical protein BELL_0134g00050 [Botrytis elliptica]